ncbi:hypothetical protein LBMAG53_19570 [Planctomycetota bacterium]|nr:hypothetical protein LBMAG53_19570 [Planctomycetota bacterium]
MSDPADPGSTVPGAAPSSGAAASPGRGEPPLALKAVPPPISARDRYRSAEDHPAVREIQRRFQAEIVAREPVTREEWLKRFTAAL